MSSHFFHKTISLLFILSINFVTLCPLDNPTYPTLAISLIYCVFAFSREILFGPMYFTVKHVLKRPPLLYKMWSFKTGGPSQKMLVLYDKEENGHN